MMRRLNEWRVLLPAALIAPLLLGPIVASAQDPEGGVSYVTENDCEAVLNDLQSRASIPAAELTFVTQVCHASRLVDFKARTETNAVASDNGSPRNLPNVNQRDLEGETALDRQIREATFQSQQSWEELAQGDPQAAYDLLKRLIGDQGNN